VSVEQPLDDSSELQFDRVVPQSTPLSPPDAIAVTCASCQAAIATEYYDINGSPVCSACRSAIEAAADTPRGIAPLALAGAFGLGAGIAGAAIYYAVIAITNFEIGLVAILIGYMVGYAVRRGAGGGGRRFQVLGVALTYLAVALAYTPIAIKGAMEAKRSGAEATASAGSASRDTGQNHTPGPGPRPGGGRNILLALAALLFLIVALPVLVIVGSFPSGLISGFIIGIGMRQAWRMTGAPVLQVYGPYRVGDAHASTLA